MNWVKTCDYREVYLLDSLELLSRSKIAGILLDLIYLVDNFIKDLIRSITFGKSISAFKSKTI